MSDFQDIEVIERFSEGLKKAASRCRELAKMKKRKEWIQVAESMDQLRLKGEQMWNSKALTRQEMVRGLDAHVAKMANEG